MKSVKKTGKIMVLGKRVRKNQIVCIKIFTPLFPPLRKHKVFSPKAEREKTLLHKHLDINNQLLKTFS